MINIEMLYEKMETRNISMWEVINGLKVSKIWGGRRPAGEDLTDEVNNHLYGDKDFTEYEKRVLSGLLCLSEQEKQKLFYEGVRE